MTDLDIKLSAISALGLATIGACAAIYLDNHMEDVQLANEQLVHLNMELIREAEALRYCVPKPGGRAVITIVAGRPFCEVHNKIKG